MPAVCSARPMLTGKLAPERRPGRLSPLLTPLPSLRGKVLSERSHDYAPTPRLGLPGSQDTNRTVSRRRQEDRANSILIPQALSMGEPPPSLPPGLAPPAFHSPAAHQIEAQFQGFVHQLLGLAVILVLVFTPIGHNLGNREERRLAAKPSHW